jgi:hypothetical protein
MEPEKVIDLLCERVLIDDNDPQINKIWDELTETLSQDLGETINFLKNCSASQLYYISEVFEDIAYNFKNIKFIDILNELNIRYPDLNMESDIELAKSYIE